MGRDKISLHLPRIQKGHEGLYKCQSNDPRIQADQVQVVVVTEGSNRPLALPQLEELPLEVRIENLEDRMDRLEDIVNSLANGQMSSVTSLKAKPRATLMIIVFFVVYGLRDFLLP